MRIKQWMAGVSVAIVLFAGSNAHGGFSTFSDGFEANALAPFWSTTLINGELTVPSTGEVHSGTGSLKLTTTSVSANKYAFIEHQFAIPVYGGVSLWVFDSGADLGTSNNLVLGVSNSLTGEYAGVSAFDYDLVPGNGSDYVIGSNSLGNVPTGVDRTQAWHYWAISSSPSSLVFTVDAQQWSFPALGFAFDLISIGLEAPGFRPGHLPYYFDDATLSATSAVPEPGTLSLVVAAAVSLGIGAVRMRQMRRSGHPADDQALRSWSGCPSGKPSR